MVERASLTKTPPSRSQAFRGSSFLWLDLDLDETHLLDNLCQSWRLVHISSSLYLVLPPLSAPSIFFHPHPSSSPCLFHISPPPFSFHLTSSSVCLALPPTFSHTVHILCSPALTLPSSSFSFPHYSPSTASPFHLTPPTLTPPSSLLPCPLTSSSSTHDHIKYLCCWNRGRLLKHTHYCQPFC